MRLNEIQRVELASLPTVIESTPRLAEAVGLEKLLIKRDDNTGLALGGNKARKLEYLMAEAQAMGADIVLACGGPQSNHVRMSAAAAKKLGMDCIIFMPRAALPEKFDGNLMLDTVLGAEIRFLPDTDFTDLDRVMAEEEAHLISQARVPYVIPLGGSTALGALGYVTAIREAAGQLREMGVESADIVTALGTGGTLAGMVLGTYLFMPESRIIGVSVLWKEEEIRPRVEQTANEAAKLVGIGHEPDLTRMEIFDEYIGKGYAIPTNETTEAILLTARTEGVILDPVYTGKAMAGLIDLARQGVIGSGRPVIFWHTGGAPALFTFESLFHDEAVKLSGM